MTTYNLADGQVFILKKIGGVWTYQSTVSPADITFTDNDTDGLVDDGELSFPGTSNESDKGYYDAGNDVYYIGTTSTTDAYFYVSDPTVVGDPNTFDFDAIMDLMSNNYENYVFCFAGGTQIETDGGKRDVAALEVGDLVLTRDNGYQPIRWIGTRKLDAAKLAQMRGLTPIRIAAGALGTGLPEQDLLVSPQHRMLVEGARAELLFGENAVLASAKSLVNDQTIRTDTSGEAVTYYHVLFDDHEIIRANGSWSESFHPGAEGLKAIDPAAKAELFALFPELLVDAQARRTAVPALKPTEAALLR